MINTHWHGDHTGGNENFGKGGAVIIAHNNVRTRMSTEQVMAAMNQTIPASPTVALPVLTFPTRATFHWNGNTVNVTHVDNAHTDGDSIVHFTNLNAFHMGDTFVNGQYPFIDYSSNGSIEGIIAAAEFVLARSDANTKIIPGHGALATPNDLRAYLNVVRGTRDRIQTLITQGRSEDDVVAAKPTAEWDADLGRRLHERREFHALFVPEPEEIAHAARTGWRRQRARKTTAARGHQLPRAATAPQPSHSGSTSDTHGTYVTTISAASSTTSHGSAARTTTVDGQLRDARRHEQVQADRRRDHADLHVHGHDDARDARGGCRAASQSGTRSARRSRSPTSLP